MADDNWLSREHNLESQLRAEITITERVDIEMLAHDEFGDANFRSGTCQ